MTVETQRKKYIYHFVCMGGGGDIGTYCLLTMETDEVILDAQVTGDGASSSTVNSGFLEAGGRLVIVAQLLILLHWLVASIMTSPQVGF